MFIFQRMKRLYIYQISKNVVQGSGSSGMEESRGFAELLLSIKILLLGL